MLSLKMMRAWLAYGASFLLTGAAIGNAYIQKKQFYPAVVYLSKSNPSLAILAVQALVFLIFVAKLVRKLYFGQLRAAEVEHLIEKSWYAVTETCLAFTVFRDDFSPKFVALFTILLFVKAFHWLGEDRIDYMERSPMLGVLFHTRAIAMTFTLGVIDLMFMYQAYNITITKGATVQLVFGFEYAILFTSAFIILCKYSLHCIDLYDENPWENKAVHLLYLELFTSCVKFTLYVIFVVLMSKFHAFPLFAVRPLYLTMRSFKKAIQDVAYSRRAIRQMNELYPNATPEELEGIDVCIICREEMVTACKKLPCSHIFHESCLRSWFQRQQTCPTCRMEVLRPQRAAAGAQGQRIVINAQQPAQPGAAPLANPWQAFNAGLAAAHNAAAHAAHAANGQQPANQQPAPTPAANQPGQPPAAAAAGAAAAAAAAAPAAQAVPNAQVLPPFMQFPPPPPGAAPAGMPFHPAPGLPPMPMFMPMGPPPPMPSANIQALSTEQLQRMEGEERDKVELRIQWLRDIQTLLDAAVEQMHQYSTLMPSTQAPPMAAPSAQPTTPSAPDVLSPPAATAAPPSHPVISPTSSAASSGTTHTSEATTSSGIGARPKTSISSPLNTTKTSSAASKSESADNIVTASQEESPASDASSNQEQEELRRRRIARFSSATDSSSSSPPS